MAEQQSADDDQARIALALLRDRGLEDRRAIGLEVLVRLQGTAPGSGADCIANVRAECAGARRLRIAAILGVSARVECVMKYLILFLIGLAVGALAATSAVNALARSHAWPRGLMEVMQHEYGGLREAVRSGKCAAPTREKLWLAQLAADVEPAFYPDSAADAPFREYTQRLHESIAALPEMPTDCATLAPIVTKIGNDCEACHRQYR
jgi:cytochrome c556